MRISIGLLAREFGLSFWIVLYRGYVSYRTGGAFEDNRTIRMTL